MSWGDVFTLAMSVVGFVGLLLYMDRMERRLEDKSFEQQKRMHHLGQRLSELSLELSTHRQGVTDDMVRALTKADNAFSLAHQANMTAKKGSTIRLQLDPVRIKFIEKKDGPPPVPPKGQA